MSDSQYERAGHRVTFTQEFDPKAFPQLQVKLPEDRWVDFNALRRLEVHASMDGQRWWLTQGSLRLYEGDVDYLHARMRGTPTKPETVVLKEQVDCLVAENQKQLEQIIVLEHKLESMREMYMAACRYHKAQSARYHRELGEAIDLVDKLGVYGE